MVCAERRLHIRVEADDNGIRIINNCAYDGDLVKMEEQVNSTRNESHKIGLQNIRNRYRFFTKKELKIEKNNYFKVFLPLIHQEA
jgi:sensor histidine kinase YesM